MPIPQDLQTIVNEYLTPERVKQFVTYLYQRAMIGDMEAAQMICGYFLAWEGDAEPRREPWE